MLRWTMVLTVSIFATQVAIGAISLSGAENSQNQAQSAQQKASPITVKVKDASGQPFIGAVVLVEGTQIAKATDSNGEALISASPEQTLVVSFMSYKTKTLPVGNNLSFDVTLDEEAIDIQAVVVTALGIKRQSKALSYSVQEVNTSAITAVKDANFVSSLAGKVAGVTINSSASGAGGAAKVVMRGEKSLSKSNNTLYVVDGVPLMNSSGGGQDGLYAGIVKSEGIADFNPEDVESMSVLSGPSAAALYGSQAANGAILITTKQGKSGQTRVSISNNTDFTTPFAMPSFQSKYGNRAGEFSSWGDIVNSNYSPTDFFQTGSNVTTAVSLSTGTENNQTYISLASTNARGIIPNNKYNRYNFNIRNTSKFLKDKMTLDLNANFIIQNDQNMLSQGQYFNPLVEAYLFPRNESWENVQAYERYDPGRKIMTQFWPYGDQGMQMQNPYWIINRNKFGTHKDRYMFSANLKYEITDWLNISGRARIDNSYSKFEKKYYASTAAIFGGENGLYRLDRTVESQIYGDVLINFNKTWGKWSLMANVGASIQDVGSDLNGYQGMLTIPNLFVYDNIDKNGRDTYPEQYGWREQTQSVFASAEVGYGGMAYLSVTARNDWASQLAGSQNPSFFYPSVGLSLVISEMANLGNTISFLKVRGSYSSVGSAPSRFLTMPTFPYDKNTGLGTMSHMPKYDWKPENTESFEAGLTLRLWGNRLSLDATYYKSNTLNQTFSGAAPAASGYSSFYIQAGNVENQGVEAMLTLNNNFGKDWNWTTSFIFGLNRNKIISLADDYINPVTGERGSINEMTVSTTGSYMMRLTKGGSMGDIYTTKKIRRDNQDKIWVDPNSNTIQVLNQVEKVGSTSPDFNLSWNNSLSWKGINLSFLITARVGGIAISGTQAIMDKYGVSAASANARDNGGVQMNSGKMDAEYWYNTIGGIDGVLDQYVYSSTNIRLQEVSLGYTFPRKWFNDKLGLNVSFIGRNLWMIYCKAPFDPESAASTGTFYQGMDYFMQPSTKSLGFSVKIQF